MKKKAVIIIIACVVVLAGIILAYFTLPISYAGTSEKHYIGVLDEHKLILPTEAQASLIKNGMPMKEVFDTIGLPQVNYGLRYSSEWTKVEFHLRDGHRLWVEGYGDNLVVTHSDYPYQTYKDYTERHKEREDANNEHIADGLNKSETA